MKIYVAGSLFSEADQAQRLKEGKLLKEAGFDVYNPLEQPFNTHKENLPTPEEIFLGDYKAVKNADIVIADLANNDPGVIAELGLAYEMNKYIIAVDSDIRLPSANRYKIPTYGMNHFVLGMINLKGKICYSFKEALEEAINYRQSKEN